MNFDARSLLELRLASHSLLGPGDRDLLGALSFRTEDLPARQIFIREGDEPRQSCFVVSGVVVRSRYTAEGQRQILSVHIAGDMPDLQSLHINRMDHDLETASASRVAFVQHDDLHRLCSESTLLNVALWRTSLVDAALHRAAIFRNGQLEATARLAHFLCEMQMRHAAIGLAEDDGFAFPFSQELIGEVLGLTIVSINRASQALRARDLIRMQRGRVQVLDWDGLARFGQFDGTFLHLRQTVPVARAG